MARDVGAPGKRAPLSTAGAQKQMGCVNGRKEVLMDSQADLSHRAEGKKQGTMGDSMSA